MSEKNVASKRAQRVMGAVGAGVLTVGLAAAGAVVVGNSSGSAGSDPTAQMSKEGVVSKGGPSGVMSKEGAPKGKPDKQMSKE